MADYDYGIAPADPYGPLGSRAPDLPPVDLPEGPPPQRTPLRIDVRPTRQEYEAAQTQRTPPLPAWPGIGLGDLIGSAAAAERPDVSPWGAKQPPHKPPADMPVPALDEAPSPWGATLPEHVPRAAPPAPPSGPVPGAGEALREGYLDITALGARPEVRAASVASGLPEWLGGFRAPVGKAEMWLEGGSGPVTRAYQTELQAARARQQAAFEAHPDLYRDAEAAGLGVTLAYPAVRAAQGAGWIARALAATATGAGYGALHGAATAEPGSELSGGLTGAGVGGGAGFGLSSGISAVAPLANAAKLRFQNWWQGIRGLVDQGYIDEEAARRILTQRWRDMQARGGPALTQQDLDIATRAHIPITNVERGAGLQGESTTALARSAANRSDQARTLLANLAHERFQGQGLRARNFISSLFGGTPNAAAEIERLEQQARIANAPAYRAAYQAGDRPLRSDELDRLMGAPDVVKAMRSAVPSSQNRAIAEGHGAFNPGVTVTDDGRVIFRRGPGGVPIYPNLQYWDSVHRDLSDMVARAVEREPSKSVYLTQLHQQLTNELDRLVPEFGNARAGAARFLGAKSAYEAGQKFVMTTEKDANYKYRQALRDMTIPEQQLASRGFASELINRIQSIPDNRDILNATFLNNANARERIQLALRPHNADQIEAYLRVESMADRLRGALGNSTTARQLHELGMSSPHGGGVSGGLIGALAAEHYGGHISATVAAVLAAVLTAQGNRAQVSIAHRIGELLASENPIQISRAMQLAGRYPQIMEALRAIHNDLPAVTGRAAGQIPTNPVENR